MKALDKLLLKNDELKFVCVGLDSDLNKIPKYLLSETEPILEFNRNIVEATKEFAAAYKINFAFYEALGQKGFEIIEKTLEFIPDDILTIADAKRGDIENTSEMYAKSVFEHFGFDAITLHPYMGKDSLQPFLNYKDKLNFILALTSNPGYIDFEKQILKDGTFLYQKVISSVAQWNQYKNCGIVFGATNLDELQLNINLFSDLSILLPGVGAQGGSFEDVIKIFHQHKRKNFIVNVSRAMIYLSSDKDFSQLAEKEIQKLNDIAKTIFIK
ncbi:Orotidine-5'-phosphate decarboxylase [Ignavibacterium album JCM 16511]|uniref:Orotidine-5'-phosphate decarboxylase n=1 Tax=Ignavibacterium album (strain DSM 19864 / JCM 16511 / NBRC 101810 / Mat9-16) TaxID=945713 RepID=I0AKP6_IGNAJ|nr:orotidine-5'-phosphate decarboxylase [Ignavibacterium album]AFH49553.1 Orotidine-5'-phosphate decarboxylase [Ignavibacterium album JCM 16511]